MSFAAISHDSIRRSFRSRMVEPSNRRQAPLWRPRVLPVLIGEHCVWLLLREERASRPASLFRRRLRFVGSINGVDGAQMSCAETPRPS